MEKFLEEAGFVLNVQSSNAESYFLDLVNVTRESIDSIEVEELIEGTSFTLSEETLHPGTIYYWRVQGYDIDGIQFGDVSNILSFKTKGEQKVVKDIEDVDTEYLNKLEELVLFYWEYKDDNSEIEMAEA